jgi:hypothetical protein
MNKKLLLTSALAGVVAFTGSVMAETKIGGDIEVTLRSHSRDAATDETGGTGLGSESNVQLEGSKDMDNGMTLNYGFKIDAEDAVGHGERYMGASGDGMYIGYGDDMGKGIDLDGTVVPHVGDQNDTLPQVAVSFSSSYMDTYSSDSLRVGFDVLGGNFGLVYAPELGSTNADSGSPTEADGPSAYTVGYKGSLGVEGLSVMAGITKSDENQTATTGKSEFTKFGAAYNLGQVSVGFDVQDYDTGHLDTSDTSTGNQTKRVGATFSASDNLSIGVNYSETERSLGSGDSYADRQANTKEEITAVTVGYNIAGLGFNFSYATTDNVGNVSGTDSTGWQIQTKQKF